MYKNFIDYCPKQVYKTDIVRELKDKLFIRNDEISFFLNTVFNIILGFLKRNYCVCIREFGYFIPSEGKDVFFKKKKTNKYVFKPKIKGVRFIPYRSLKHKMEGFKPIVSESDRVHPELKRKKLNKKTLKEYFEDPEIKIILEDKNPSKFLTRIK